MPSRRVGRYEASIDDLNLHRGARLSESDGESLSVKLAGKVCESVGESLGEFLWRVWKNRRTKRQTPYHQYLNLFLHSKSLIARFVHSPKNKPAGLVIGIRLELVRFTPARNYLTRFGSQVLLA